MKRIVPYPIFLLFIPLLLGYCLAPVAEATIYKWVDENGTLHFGNTPSQTMQPEGQLELAPPSQAYLHRERPEAKKQQLKAVSKKILVGKQASQVYREAEVELYTTSWCNYCKKTRAFLNRRGVSFSECDIEVNAEAAVRKQETDGRPGVPFALVNGQAIHGFLPQAYERALQYGL